MAQASARRRPPAIPRACERLPRSGPASGSLALPSSLGYTRTVADLAPGTVLGGCRVDSVVGKGGMGVVYRARQLDLDRDVALKVISPELVEDSRTRARFLSEARAAGAV